MSNKVAAAYGRGGTSKGTILEFAQRSTGSRLDELEFHSIRSATNREAEPEPMPHPLAYAEVNYATFVTPTQAGILAVAEIPPHRFRYAVTLIFVISDIRDLVLRRKSMGNYKCSTSCPREAGTLSSDGERLLQTFSAGNNIRFLLGSVIQWCGNGGGDATCPAPKISC